MIKVKLRAINLLLLMCLSGIAAAQVDNKVLPLDPAVRTGKLPNGFTYFIRHNEEPKNRVVMYLVNKVGSILETDDQRGLAHFMEHMSFNGTTNFPKNELVNYLQKSGVRFGADINAYTSFDETVYELPLPTDNPDLLKNGIQIMRDWAHNATLDADEINKERGVVLEEKRLGKGAAERMRRIYFPLILNNSRYAERTPIGTDEVLNNFKPEAIKRFYQDWYRPDLQALIVVGDIDVDQMEQTIKAKFGDLKNPVNEKQRTRYTVPLTSKNQFVVVTDKEMTATTAEVLFKHAATEMKTAIDYRKGIVNSLFNQMIAYRYAEVTRQADPPFVQGGAGISDFIANLDNYGVSVTAKPGELEKGFKAVWRESERVKRFGFTETELERAKIAYLSSMESALKEKDKIQSINLVQEYQEYFLKGTAATGIVLEYDMAKSDMPGITLEEVNALINEYTKPVNRDILIMAPEKDKAQLPDEATITGWMSAVEKENIVPYKEEANKLPLLAKEPVAGKIVSEKKDDQLNITTLILSNGIKVILKPTEFRNNQVLFNGFSPGGTSLYNDVDYQSAASSGSVIPAGGVGNYNVTDLGKYMSGKQAAARPFINERSQGINGSSTLKDLESALQLTYAYLTEPRKDVNAFKGIITRSKASMANRSSDPKTVFNDTISAVLGNHNIRRTAPSIQKIEQIDLDKAYAIYKERFADASGFTFTFVGSFDVTIIKPLLEKYLGGLPSTNAHQVAKDLGIHAPAGRVEKTVYKGTEPKATIDLVFSGTYEHSASNNIKMNALKEVLEIRLLERLREDESGVYSPQVSVSTAKYPEGRYSLVVSFGCAPQNVEKLITSALDEIGKLRTVGATQVNLDKFRAEDKTSTETQLKSNGWWLSYLVGQLQNKESLNEVDNYIAALDKVTVDNIKEMSVKYLSGKNYIRFVLLPETK
ncbi:MAG: insulinase family protein [Mucilaginibacter sp.]|uniref:M16 family metallopeptidase n=1 Tax=Mucilaginibacter sp. TaxID=1882438 RepID=UPI003267C7EA